MRTDSQIQLDVMAQLKWNPLLNASAIGVAVKDGVVTLSGEVDTYAKKLQAEKEARKVAGVKALAEDLQVGLRPGTQKTDTALAAAVVHALKWHTSVPEDKLKVKVEEGVVTLEGEVEWAFQLEAVRHAVLQLEGVRSLQNRITLLHKVTPDDLKQKIRQALLRSATLDADKIQVSIKAKKAILIGYVRSLTEKDEAEEAVWGAPGILFVENRLKLEEAPELFYWAN